MPESEDIKRRAAVWHALSALFVDTQLQAAECRYIASVVLRSGFTPSDLQRILWAEVFPALSDNLQSVAGEWAGFSEPWLEERIKKVMSEGPPQLEYGGSISNAAVVEIIADAWLQVCEFLPSEYREGVAVP